jgi:hypothetical protein
MSTVAEFTIPADAFPLGRLFEGLEDVCIELERVVPTSPGVIPYVWVQSATRAEVEAIVRAGERVAELSDIRLVDEVKGDFLLRLSWGPNYEGILRGITETDVTLVSGVGSADSWTFEIRGDSRKQIAAFQRYCAEHEQTVSLRALNTLSSAKSGATYDLTEPQREALVLAHRRGYYHSPREVTLEDLASEVGISGQAFGSRLRRGIDRLVGSTIAPTD